MRRSRRGGEVAERPALDETREHGLAGDEDAGAPRDDLGGAAQALDRGEIAVGRPLELDAQLAHRTPAREPPAVSERERGALGRERLVHLGGGERESALEPEGVAKPRGLGRAEHAPDEGFARVGDQPSNAHPAGEPVPQRE